MINQGGGKKSGGWEAQGGPSDPPDFDRGVAPPPWTPLETASDLTTEIGLRKQIINLLLKNVFIRYIVKCHKTAMQYIWFIKYV